jgi:DNA-binding transcriptional LysR family regulator
VPAADVGLAWRVIAVDPVCVLLPATHPLAGQEEIELAALANEHWAAAPGDGCFADCFATACARAGFTPRTLYETDIQACLDLVEAGEAVALCQATFRALPGLATRPIAGAPLRWRLLLGWHPDSPAADTADRVFGHALDAYAATVARNPDYLAWLERHPGFGAATTATN